MLTPEHMQCTIVKKYIPMVEEAVASDNEIQLRKTPCLQFQSRRSNMQVMN
jgi:hypothetical protein